MAANHYNSTAQNGNSSASIQEPDEMSFFLQQIFLRSASSSSLSDKMCHRSFSALSNHILDGSGGPGTGMGQIHVPDHHPPLLNSSSGFSFTAANLPSPSAGKLDSEADEYEYESEDVIEAVVEETLPRRVSQSSSKRSRAAEVHNLSEKRRRSRINEKMKALQNLIPNSNKTDKASMLDEAIEYLKQLQLQVQMLTMRNGLSLYPNQMPHMSLDTHDPDNLSKSILMDRHMPEDVLLSAHDKCVKPRPVTDFSCAIDSKASFRMPSPHFGTYQHLRPYEGICEAKPRLTMPLDDDRRRSNLSGSEVTSLLPPESNPCIGEARGDDIVQNFVDHPIFSSQSNM